MAEPFGMAAEPVPAGTTNVDTPKEGRLKYSWMRVVPWPINS